MTQEIVDKTVSKRPISVTQPADITPLEERRTQLNQDIMRLEKLDAAMKSEDWAVLFRAAFDRMRTIERESVSLQPDDQIGHARKLGQWEEQIRIASGIIGTHEELSLTPPVKNVSQLIEEKKTFLKSLSEQIRKVIENIGKVHNGNGRRQRDSN